MTNYLLKTYLQQLCDQENEPRVIIKAQRPRFDIVVYNSRFAQISQTQGRELAGISMAEIQSWNSKNEDGALEIYDAIMLAIKTKTTVQLPAVRYYLPGENHDEVASLWQAVYEPLQNTKNEVAYLLCKIQLVTEQKYEPVKMPETIQLSPDSP